MSAAPDLPPERLPGVSGARTYKALDDQTVLEALTPQVAADPGTCPHPVMCQTARLTAPDGSVTTILRCPECGHENVWNDPPPNQVAAEGRGCETADGDGCECGGCVL